LDGGQGKLSITTHPTAVESPALGPGIEFNEGTKMEYGRPDECEHKELSWECWMSECQNEGQNDRHVFVGPTCHRHVGQHASNMTQKNVSRGTANVGPTCHLLTCWQYVGNMLANLLAQQSNSKWTRGKRH
jgi:hypothetical protein